MKLTLCRIAVASLALLSSRASADIIDLNPPPGLPYFGPDYIQDNIQIISSAGGSLAYGNWIAAGAPQFNADGSAADLFTTAPGANAIFFIPNFEVTPFNFTSIGLASATNDRTGGDVAFTFFHHDGTIDTTVVSLQPGRLGLQTFAFNEQNVTEVVFFALSTEGNLIQFDHIGIAPSVAVPGPIAGTGLPGLIALGGLLAWRRRRRELTTLVIMNELKAASFWRVDRRRAPARIYEYTALDPEQAIR